MNRMISWFVHNKVAANLLMTTIFITGLLSLGKIKTEVFPEFSTDIILISVAYLGAAPEEVEEGVCVKIEEAIQGLEGIKKITSTASEGRGTVSVELVVGYDIRKLLDDIRSRVDQILTFPLETEEPVIQEALNRRQVLNVAVTGNTDERSLKSISDEMRDEISDLPEVSQVEVGGARPYEISIEVAEDNLRKFDLTFSEVVEAIRASSLDLPGGSIKTSSGELTIRTKGQVYKGSEYEKLIIRSLPDGTRLNLGDVANVIDGFAETDQSARFDGKTANLVQVYRVGDENAIKVASAVKEYVKVKQNKLPDGITITVWQDDSLVFDDRLSLLLRNGRSGFILVFLALALFLRLRLAWWVIVGMIMSFFGAFWVIPQFDASINMISMFAFILVLGIVVDDAIVIGENIYSHLEKGEDALKAAIKGTQEVATPVIFAILTTVAAFSPLMFVSGFMGKIMEVIPIIVISTLLFSLIESIFILPSHLSHMKPKKDKTESNNFKIKWNYFQQKFQSIVNNFVETYYKKILEIALEWRYLSLAIGLSILILTFSFVGGGWIKFVFMPEVEADNVVALLTMPQGTSKTKTAEVIRKLEESADTLNKELNGDGKAPIDHILASIGEQPFLSRQMGAGGPVSVASSSHLGEVNLQLISAETREVTSMYIEQRWRELTGIIPEVEELTFSSSLFSAGDPVNIQISGVNYEELLLASNEIQNKIAEYPGTYDISDSYKEGKSEIKLRIKPEAEAIGVFLSSVAMQVRQAFYGEEVQRIQRGRDDIRVMVRYPEDKRKSINDLENMRIRIPGGGVIPFKAAASIESGTGFSSISRTDRKRAINITSNVDIAISNPNEIVDDLKLNALEPILNKYSGISYSFEGEQSAQIESMQGLLEGFMFAMLIIYVLLAIPFKSYVQPFIVMSAIPFGFIGAIMGHIILGYNLTIISGFGIVALTGVVVNDSLVFVDFINKNMNKGEGIQSAIIKAGVSRFRPIMLTSITTFAGLTPLMLEKSMQAQFLIPMAISLAFGVLFATVITLILVPTFYNILDDVKAYVAS